MNSRRSPERVVVCHLFDQVDLSLWDFGSAAFVSALPSPIQSEGFFVPSNDGLRLDDQQRLLPGVVEVCQHTDEESIGWS